VPNLYRYKVRDKSGDLISGVVRGESEASVEIYLESLEFMPIKISVERKSSLRQLLNFRRGKPRLEDLILVNRKLSTLYRAGIPIVKSLEIVSEQYEDSPFGDVLLAVRDDIERGELLSASIAKHPRFFSTIYVSSVRAAEASGKLDVVLESLADAMEQEAITREEIGKALRYPVMVVVAIAIAVAILMTFVVPKFMEFYSSYDAELPMPTQIIIAISSLFSSMWYIIFPAMIGAGYALTRLIRRPEMRRIVDSFLLKVPILSSLLVKTSLSRFSHILSVLIASGTPLIQSLDIVKDAVGNVIIGSEVGKLGSGLREGKTLDECRHHMQHFPKIAISLIHVGLESGTLELTLSEISRYFDREVRYMSSRLTSLLEPFLIAIMGGMVLVLALAIFLPMWNLISIFKG
jgi:type II secretory pathway component PulF